MDDLTQKERDKIVFVADKFEEIRKTIKEKGELVYCVDCGKSFQLCDEDKERIKFGVKFVIICPFCGGDDVSVQANRVV
jgi:Zn finger protein HypA/HybF involved in hydrogenase expression